MAEISAILISYILGSVPFGFLVGYFVKKIDIRKFGSGNIGATNVLRVVGKNWGVLVFVLDFLKGFLAPVVVGFLLNDAAPYVFILSAIAVVCGHNWTIFLKFKGGKGVATSVGALAGLSLIFSNLWIVLILSVCVWIIVFRIFRYVSLASLSGAFSFLLFSLIFTLPWEIRILTFIIFIFILLSHKSNITRLLSKKENRF